MLMKRREVQGNGLGYDEQVEKIEKDSPSVSWLAVTTTHMHWRVATEEGGWQCAVGRMHYVPTASMQCPKWP